MEKETKKTEEKTPRKRSKKNTEKEILQTEEKENLKESNDQNQTPILQEEVAYTEQETQEENNDSSLQIEQEEQEAQLDKNELRIAELLQNQKNFFATNRTRSYQWRIEQLKKLYALIESNKEKIFETLYKDLNKSNFESYITEVGFVLKDISYHIKHLKKWCKAKKVFADLHLFPAKLSVTPEPFGSVLILSTWNYPFLLAMQPLVAAISAGNTVILKTSEYSNATNDFIDSLISKNFNSEYITVVRGGYAQNQALLNQHFDFIFFTGSQNVGKIVMSNASRFTTPVCLELGGKNPCIVDDTADISIAAKRIAWGKFLNAGQTCVAPDYILVDKKIKAPLIAAIKDEVKKQFGEKPLVNKEYPKIINERHFVHLSTLCPYAEMDFITNKIAPTVIDLCDVTSKDINSSSLMQEEIFGPLLPVITFENLREAISYVSSKPSPLALYLFSTDKEVQKEVMYTIRFGGGCINDVIYHIASTKAPFGGVGASGIGSYHGKYGFKTFSHYKTVLEQKPHFDLNVRYASSKPKTTKKRFRILRTLLH